MQIIAAFAQFSNGKDTICDYLAENLPLNSSKWKRSAFANAVKDLYCRSFNVDRAFIEKWKRISENPPGMLMPVRQSLQMIGDGFRKIKQDIWVDIILNDNESQIISDGRYISEAKAVRGKGGINILIYRDGYLNDDPSESESELRPIIEFCRDNLQAGVIQHNSLRNMPKGMEYFDIYLENKTNIKEFLQKSYKIIFSYFKLLN